MKNNHHTNFIQPDLNGAFFVKQSGTKKREWKADKAAKLNSVILINIVKNNKNSNNESNTIHSIWKYRSAYN
ncbi:hypothetical protein AR438_05405 [Chryseobacterium aquaticum]|uniref:Uncharacterized protein n=1 Tax=Chryseobacterium aquaticum TaxID=452084 RepID=A0A0Q3HUZ8_9FLAO|nr:hypothetical protein AR438_05405 [Chryseobacterium aquaticum]